MVERGGESVNSHGFCRGSWWTGRVEKAPPETGHLSLHPYCDIPDPLEFWELKRFSREIEKEFLVSSEVCRDVVFIDCSHNKQYL